MSQLMDIRRAEVLGFYKLTQVTECSEDLAMA